MPTHVDFYTSIKPYRILARIFSIQSVTRNKDGLYVRSIVQFATAALHVAIFSICYYFGFQDNEREIDVSDVYVTSFSVYNILVIVRFAIIFVLSLKNASIEIKLHQHVDRIDALLRSLGKTEELNEGNKALRTGTIKTLILGIFTQFITEGFNYVVAYKRVTPLILGMSFLPSYVGTLNKCYFYIWCSVLRNRIQILNGSFRSIKKRSKLKQYSFSVYKFEKELSQLMDLHQELVSMSRMMNDMFEIEIVWHFTIIFNLIFANGYYTMFIMTTRKKDLMVYPFTLVENSVYVYFEFFILVYTSTKLCAEAAAARDVLIGIRMDIFDETSHRLVITSIYELNENKLEITACRLFNINYSTVFAVINLYFPSIRLEFHNTTSSIFRCSPIFPITYL
ncbi:PREDICTED: uncharacterized protein LOC108559112 [Nicrophorus vespilloides]|uniref:Gustatory receptor n=1 Tax=Nicrophorus vespilloides TaxID=110193 RepID=A0ABM1MAZ5_NICVS|nr:PREDICTED: uncharacterized protein LOC108559112 [Nicrophorus vespilloides]